MEDYEYLTTVGEGAYSVVYKCRDKRNGQVVAVKSFKQAHELKEVRRLAEREVSVLRSVRHPGLVELQAAFRSPRGRIYLVFPYYGVSAYQLLRAFQKEQLQQQRIERQLIGLGGGYGGCGGLPALELKLMAWQMLQALSYLHKNQIVHRDVKPANILMTADGVARLCDFGFARPTHCGPLEVQRMSSYVVTRWYRAPGT